MDAIFFVFLLSLFGGSSAQDGGADSCDPTPLRKVVTLPTGCTEDSSKSNKVNLGTCSYDECIKRGLGDTGSCGGGDDNTWRCCSPTSFVNISASCTNGEKISVVNVTGCACSVCAVPDSVVHGRIVDPDGNPLEKGEIWISVQGEKKRYSTDRAGNFTITVKKCNNRLVLNIKDPDGKLQETTKAFDLHMGQISFYTIILQKKPPVIKFSATQKQNIFLGTIKPSFVAVSIPEVAFVTADGNVYDGEITANIGLFDQRSATDMAAAPGDFSAIDDNGEEVMLGTAGILRQSFTDSFGNKLNLYKNITIRIDANMLDILDGVTVFQYYLSEGTGRWVKFGVLRNEEEERQRDVGMTKRQAPRKFFVGDITPNVPYDTINWDYEQTASYVRVLAPPGTVVTRIGLSDDGQSFSSYRQETVPSSGILCMLSLRDKRAVMQADLNEAPLVPQQPRNFPAVVNPQIISVGSSSNPFKIQSFRYTSSAAGDTGPVYLKSQSGRCQQRGLADLAFQFQEANAGEAFHWESPREPNPNSNLFWNVLSPEICFVKALVTGSIPDSVIYVKSTGKARGQPVLNYGYTAEKAARVGNEGVVCLEYRCNEGGSANAYQTHLQVITLTGKCTITELNSLLRPYSTGQTRCSEAPDGSSNQEQNFCVPKDLQGGDAGLYIGDIGVARSRCLTGDNNYSQGRPQPTNVNPTVRLNCS